MAQASATDIDEAAERPSVMLIDDDEVTLMLTGVALREHGFDITEVPSGERALELLVDGSPDIVVLDAMMPVLDGFDTCRLLRALPGYENLPVLMLTGLDDEASIARAYQAGATDFFVKSTQWSLLAGRLRYLLRSSRTRQELERHKAKLARAQDLARMGSFDWRHGTAAHPGGLVMSPEGLRVFGFAPGEQVSLRRLVHLVRQPERRELHRRLIDALRRQKVLNIDVGVDLPSGRRRVMHVEAEPEFNEQGLGIGYTGIVQDVTEPRTLAAEISRQANTDALTQLPNRRQFLLRANRAIDLAMRGRHRVALLLIDLDRFKEINDQLGHSYGDQLLVEVSRRLRSCVRHSDVLLDDAAEAPPGGRGHRALEGVGRLGGDEFVALLPDVQDEQDIERVAQRMLEAMRKSVYVDGHEYFVTGSIGVAMYPRDGHTVDDLLRNADVAMYSVKNSGRNDSASFSPMLTSRGHEKLKLESALHKAIERDEVVLYYQPKVDLRSAGMVGVEALMRWQRDDRLVPPAEFIPLAEETGLIVPLSNWALVEAARQVRVWQDEFGFEGSVAVNVPARMFERRALVEQVHAAVMAAGVSHRTIQLEVTENVVMKDPESGIPALAALNEIGVEISIDDFGTGWSSMSYLTTLPISELKIDRSFVRHLGINPQSSAVVSAIIALGRALGLRVVAEGVENLAQMHELYRLGCTLMQGFMFSPPVPGREIGPWHASIVLPEGRPPNDVPALDAGVRPMHAAHAR